MTERDEVLSRGRVDKRLGEIQSENDPSVVRHARNALLAHDAAQRERIEELEEALREIAERSLDLTDHERSTASPAEVRLSDVHESARQALDRRDEEET